MACGAISTPTPPWPARGLSTSESKTSSASSSCAGLREVVGRDGPQDGLLADVEADHVLDVGVGELVVGDAGAVLVDEAQQPARTGSISSRPMSESSRSALVRR